MNLDRRSFLRGAVFGLGGWSLASCAMSRRVGPLDLALRGGLVVDGSGGEPFAADVGVRGDRIVFVGEIGEGAAARTLDVRGLVVAPGFVDIHSHSDRTILDCPTADSRVMQGYTCEVTGNCGGSAAPDRDDQPKFARVTDYFAAVEAARPSIHQALLVGHGTLRRNCIGDADRQLTEAEFATVEAALEQALADGAFGLSSGLEYVPGMFAPPEELQRLVRIVARRGRLYASHMRSEDRRLVEAADEAIAVARATGGRVQISHLKACGRANWPKVDRVIANIERAVRDGLDVRADVYPYTAYSTTLTILLPAWARDGGTDAILERLRDPDARARIRTEVLAKIVDEPGGFDLVAIASRLDGSAKGMSGRSVAEIAAHWGIDPVDGYLRLLEEEKGSVSYVGHAMQEDDVGRILAHPLTMVGSDGSSQSFAAAASVPHPRSFGTAARVLGRFVRELKRLDLPTAIRKLAALPAERVGIKERGRIAEGLYADLVAFDPATIADRATFAEPRQQPAGVRHVVVDGQVVVEGSVHTGARPGRMLIAGSVG